MTLLNDTIFFEPFFHQLSQERYVDVQLSVFFFIHALHLPHQQILTLRKEPFPTSKFSCERIVLFVNHA